MAARTPDNGIKTYRWNPDSLVTQIDVREQGKDASVAYIYAGPHDEPGLAHLQALPALLQQQGWAASLDSRDGKPVLRLTGLSGAQDLISFLEKEQQDKPIPYLKGAPDISQEKPDTHESKSWWETLKTHSLRASGIFYTLGNAFYIASGISRNAASGRKDWGQIGTGLAFSSGDLLLAAVGGKDDPRQFRSLLNKLKAHWQQHGIDVPPDAAILAETRPKTDPGEKAYDFAHEHINQIKAGAEVLGGVMYFRAGKEQQNIWKQITAVIFSLGFGSTLFIPEKKPDPEKLKDAGSLEKAWAFVQEKPLRLGGWSGLSNTLLTTVGAFKERALRNGTHHYRYDLAAAGSMLVGNNLYALSNKNTGGTITDDGLIKDIYGLAAQVLCQVPQDKREAAIKTTVDFLGERTELKDSRAEADQLLRQEMQRVCSDNPWFKAAPAKDAPTLPPPQSQQRTWEIRTQQPAQSEKAWQEAVSRQNEAASELSPITSR